MAPSRSRRARSSATTPPTRRWPAGSSTTAGTGSVTTVLSTTVSDNEASLAGGGIARLAGSVRVEASIVAGNRDTEGDLRSVYPDCFGAFASWGYNLIGNVGTSASNCSGFSATGDASVGLTAVRVRWLADTAGPADGADGEELAAGAFAVGDAPLTLAFASPLALEEGITRRLVVEVDLAHPGSTVPASALASLGSLGLLGWLALRRRRVWSVALLVFALAAALGACGGAVQGPPQAETRTYQLQLVTLEAEAPATVAGLPLLGDVLEVTDE